MGKGAYCVQIKRGLEGSDRGGWDQSLGVTGWNGEEMKPGALSVSSRNLDLIFRAVESH